MKRVTCEMCGSTDIVKDNGLFVCQCCGMKYTLEEARKLMIEGVVEVQGTVKIDNTDMIENYLKLARRAAENSNYKETEEYGNKVLEIDPNHYEAWFLKGKAAGWQSNLRKNRIEEAMECFESAVSNAPEEKKGGLLDEALLEVSMLLKAIMKMSCKNYIELRSENNAQEIWELCILSLKCLGKMQGSYKARYDWSAENRKNMKLNPDELIDFIEKKRDEVALIINNAVIDADENTIEDYWGATRHPSTHDLTRLQERMELSKTLFERAAMIACDLKTKETTLENAIDCLEKIRDAKAYSYSNGAWSPYNAWREEYIGSLNNSIAALRRTINDERTKCWEEKNKRKKERCEKFWKEHAEEKAAMEEERDNLKQEIIRIDKEEKDAPEERWIAADERRLEGYRTELKNLGLFQGKRKAELEEQIYSTFQKINKLKDERRIEIKQRKKPLLARIKEIETALNECVVIPIEKKPEAEPVPDAAPVQPEENKPVAIPDAAPIQSDQNEAEEDNSVQGLLKRCQSAKEILNVVLEAVDGQKEEAHTKVILNLLQKYADDEAASNGKNVAAFFSAQAVASGFFTGGMKLYRLEKEGDKGKCSNCCFLQRYKRRVCQACGVVFSNDLMEDEKPEPAEPEQAGVEAVAEEDYDKKFELADSDTPEAPQEETQVEEAPAGTEIPVAEQAETQEDAEIPAEAEEQSEMQEEEQPEEVPAAAEERVEVQPEVELPKEPEAPSIDILKQIEECTSSKEVLDCIAAIIGDEADEHARFILNKLQGCVDEAHASDGKTDMHVFSAKTYAVGYIKGGKKLHVLSGEEILGHCSHCGFRQRRGRKICTSCGVVFWDGIPEKETETPNQLPAQQEQPQPRQESAPAEAPVLEQDIMDALERCTSAQEVMNCAINAIGAQKSDPHAKMIIDELRSRYVEENARGGRDESLAASAKVIAKGYFKGGRKLYLISGEGRMGECPLCGCKQNANRKVCRSCGVIFYNNLKK